MHSTGKLKRAAATTLIALFVLSCVPRAHAYHDHIRKSSRRPSNLANNSLNAVLDFDADARQDRITLQSNGYNRTIQIRFGNARKAELQFRARTFDSGSLVTRDIDRDGDFDLVWLAASDRKNAVVWINDGDGNFEAVSDNSEYTSELDDLFNSNDPSGNPKVKRGRKSSVLASASFHDVGLPLLSQFQNRSATVVPVSCPERPIIASQFSSYLRKRGPPVFSS